jgi:membrane protein implicated in regulation of membrane protease activity
MLTLIAVIVALLFLPSPWGWIVVGLALAVDAVEIVVWLTMRGRRSIAGEESMLGARATAMTVCRPDGQVKIKGQIWKAHCSGGADPGDEVIVTALDGLVLTVQRRSDAEAPQGLPSAL